MGLGVPAMMRALQTAIVAGAATLLLGCGANSDQARYANLVWRLVSGNRMEVSREQAGDIPFASIGVPSRRRNSRRLRL